MLGRKIVDSFAEIEDVDGPSSLTRLSEPPPGLTVRRLKSANLRIVTESEALWPDSSKGLTSATLRQPSALPTYLSLRTPDTSHTFGRPNPTMVSPKHTLSTNPSTPASSYPSAALLAARRSSRYSRAESALRSAAEASSAEVSPQELQIRALEKATMLLREQAQDAQASAAKLRECLAIQGEKSLSPEEVQALQRECWLEQHRSAARQDQSAQARNLLTKLCSPIREVPPFPLAEPPACIARREANLARFMQLSPTRISVSSQSHSPSTSPITLQRRKTISQVQPMRLRSSALELALKSPMRTHVRSRSLDSRHSRRNSESSDTTLVSEEPHEQLVAARLKLTASPLQHEPTGSVRIEQVAAPRARDIILAEVEHVTLPDYAVGLLEDFMASSPDLELALSSPAASIPSPLFRTLPSDESHTRASVSLPDFTHDHDAHHELSPIPSRPRSSVSIPTSHILSRLRNRSDPPPDPSFTSASTQGPATRRAPTANAHVRSSVTQSLHVLPSSSRGSTLHLSSPSLVTVPEGEADGGYRPQSSMSGFFVDRRPQTSMSGYSFASPSMVLEEDEGEAGLFRKRFSISSFKRRRVGSEPNRNSMHISQDSLQGVSLRRAIGEQDGFVARFKRRIAGFGQK